MSTTKTQEEMQSLTPSFLIEMYTLDLSLYGGPLYRFCPQVSEMSGDIVWQGNTYTRLPIHISGFDRNSNGALPRPIMQVANVGGAMGQLAHLYKYFLRCKVTRKRTFSRFLDAVNFPVGSPKRLGADPTQGFQDEVWFVDRKANENPIMMEFELASSLDMPGVTLPRRQMIQNCCAWLYRGPDCGYTGGAVAKEDGTPTADLSQDLCGQRLSDCKKRFPTGDVPFGSFPGVGLVR